MNYGEVEMIRHGEIVLQPISDDVDWSEAKQHNTYIVGHSETGHHHILEGECAVLEQPGLDPIVKLFNDTPIVHQKTTDKHDTIIVKKGKYRVLRKKEYDPFEKVMREVWD